eukprot:351435-Chlamydomonas_euryale.AAC.2
MASSVVDGVRCGGWRPVWWMASGVADGVRCGGWRPVWRMASGVADGVRCGGWRPVWRMASGVADGVRCGGWRPVDGPCLDQHHVPDTAAPAADPLHVHMHAALLPLRLSSACSSLASGRLAARRPRRCALSPRLTTTTWLSRRARRPNSSTRATSAWTG